MNDSEDIENKELIKDNLIEQLDKYKRSKSQTLEKYLKTLTKLTI